MRSKTACFTGHRTHKLPWKSNERDPRCLNMIEKLRGEIINAIERGYENFICGMALGFDIICAETVLELKKRYPHIKLIGALPCRTQHLHWDEANQRRYNCILEQLDEIRCIYDDYVGIKCMLERNSFMVNNSSLLIALFNGQGGGTKKTIDYATKMGVEVVIINV